MEMIIDQFVGKAEVMSRHGWGREVGYCSLKSTGPQWEITKGYDFFTAYFVIYQFPKTKGQEKSEIRVIAVVWSTGDQPQQQTVPGFGWIDSKYTCPWWCNLHIDCLQAFGIFSGISTWIWLKF